MRVIWLCGIIVSIISVCFHVQAAENLDDWADYIEGTANIVHNGTSVTASASGSSTDYSFGRTHKYFENSIGCLGKVRMNSASGIASAGLRQTLGTNSEGNLIVAEAMLFAYQEEYSVRYRVRIRDFDTYDTIETIAYGWLGNYTGGWTLGQDVLIGFALLGEKLCFYTPQTGTFVYVKIIDELNSYEGYSQITIIADPNSIANATISDVNIIYPNNLDVFSQAVEKPKTVVIPLN